jgi:hypothetical protein
MRAAARRPFSPRQRGEGQDEGPVGRAAASPTRPSPRPLPAKRGARGYARSPECGAEAQSASPPRTRRRSRRFGVDRAGAAARLNDEARTNLAAARKFVADCGYHRRDEELAELEDVAAGRRRFADLPPRV